jgi:hypothetical protein
MEMKQMAQRTLKAIADNYQRLVAERLEQETRLIDETEATGNSAAAQHHRILAGVYRSMLENEEKSVWTKQGL